MGAFLSWTPKAGPPKSLYFDVTVEEGQEFSSTATDSPVEDGPNVSDHVKRELNRVTLEVFVSNTPIDDVNNRGGAVRSLPLKVPTYKAPFQPTPGGVYNAIGGAVKSLISGQAPEYAANVLQWSQEFDAIDETQGILETLKDTVQLVDVVLPHRLHAGMFLERIDVKRNAGSGSGATFSLSFKEIRTVKAKLTTAPIPTEVRGKAAVKKGAQAAKAASSQVKKSIAKAGAQALIPPQYLSIFGLK